MGKLIIVTGFLATLKTTISTRLGKDFQILCLNKDFLKEILSEKIGFNNRSENLKLSEATFENIRYISSKMIALGHDVIIESNFKPHEMIELAHTFKDIKKDILTLFLHSEPEIAYKRYLNRQSERHLAHLSTGTISYDLFEASMHEYSIDDAIGHVIGIDTTTFDEKDYSNLVHKVNIFLYESV